MGKGNGNATGKGIISQPPGGDHMSCTGALHVQKRMYEVDSDTEG
jgi:hypothetical protein